MPGQQPKAKLAPLELELLIGQEQARPKRLHFDQQLKNLQVLELWFMWLYRLLKELVKEQVQPLEPEPEWRQLESILEPKEQRMDLEVVVELL
jgi:hypothetical protein